MESQISQISSSYFRNNCYSIYILSAKKLNDLEYTSLSPPSGERRGYYMQIKTILFDFDGVVVDSESLHLRALGEVLTNHGISYPDDLLEKFVGKSDS